MHCQSCGTQNIDTARFCSGCGAALAVSAATPPVEPQAIHKTEVPHYLAQSIIVTILCCWPLGIPAIVFSAQTMSANSRGDYLAAKEASKKAMMWAWISFGCGAVVILGYIALIIATEAM